MANHKGSEGSVYVGANAVAELKGWSFEETAEVIDDTTLGDAAKTHQVGTTSASGSIDCFWDETDTNGQGAIAVGSEVTLNMYPEGNTTGDTYYTGSVIITGVNRQAAIDGMVEASYSWTANGAITESTAA